MKVGGGEEEWLGVDEGMATNSKCHYNSVYVHLLSFNSQRTIYIQKIYINCTEYKHYQ